MRSKQEFVEFLREQAHLPTGFRVGVTRLHFTPQELHESSGIAPRFPMNLSVISLDESVVDSRTSIACLYTRSSFPGAPVLVGRQRFSHSPQISALVINNKVFP